jgi:hypothetical protein
MWLDCAEHPQLEFPVSKIMSGKFLIVRHVENFLPRKQRTAATVL